MFEHFIFFVFSLALGFLFGYLAQKEKVEEGIKYTKSKVQSRFVKVGQVKRLTPEEIEKKHGIVGETEQVMRDTFDDLL